MSREARLFLVVVCAVVLLSSPLGASAVGRVPAGGSYLIEVANASYSWDRYEILSSRGRLLRVLANADGDLKVSPSGKVIAWVDKRGAIHTEGINSSSSRELTAPATNCANNTDCQSVNFVWSPDGRQLLVAASGVLSVVSARTGAAQQIVAPQTNVAYTAVGWSRAAGLIAYDAYNYGGIDGEGCCSDQLILADPSGSSPRLVYRPYDADYDTPSAVMSPNGRWIAFTTQGFDRRDPASAIVDVVTGSLHRLRFGARRVANVPVWASDSASFAIGGRERTSLISSQGRRVRLVHTRGRSPLLWTAAGLYLVGPWDAQRDLFVIPDKQRRPRLVCRLRRGQILLDLLAILPSRG